MLCITSTTTLQLVIPVLNLRSPCNGPWYRQGRLDNNRAPSPLTESWFASLPGQGSFSLAVSLQGQECKHEM